MCGTPFTCLADDGHIIGTTRAAVYLGIIPRAVRLAVARGKLQPLRKLHGEWLFDRADLDDYAATRRPRTVAHSDGKSVPSVASG
jgi:hypothetical protein